MIIKGGDYYYGSKATGKGFRQKPPDYSILHLVLHSEVDNTDNSKLYFTRVTSDSLEDEVLYLFERYNMDINTDQVVLSAPETGAGKITRGEGIMNLGRAYMHMNDEGLQASKEMQEIIRRRMKPSNIEFEYGEKERVLMQYLESHENIQLHELKDIARISTFVASLTLIRLVLANVLDVTPTGSGDVFLQRA